MRRHRSGKGGETEVESDAALLRLLVLVKGGSGELCAERLYEGGLAAVDVAHDADVDVEDSGGGGGCRDGRRGGSSSSHSRVMCSLARRGLAALCLPVRVKLRGGCYQITAE